MNPILKGLLIGFGTSLFVGPVFFTLLKNSIQESKFNGFITALGIIISDILVALICLIFSKEFLVNYVNQTSFQIISALIIAFFGITILYKPIQIVSNSAQSSKSKSIKPLAQGFSINFINPSVFVIWIGFITLARQTFTGQIDVYKFIIGILLGIFSTDLLKVIGASFLTNYINQHNLDLLSKVIGILLLVFSSVILLKAFS
ncbi:MAG: LysE family transporter [Bacteroidia bacterium]|nr:LysE family transporter [Bacteroidia bacterium]